MNPLAMMDSVVGEDQTLPLDINGSCRSRLPDAGDFSMDSMTAPSFPDKMSPVKALTMKDYENQITALKKENFNLKLRIYFMEEHMQQKCDDSTEDIYKTNIELKVEAESMKRDLAEKQELLVSASKALESLAGREAGDSQRVREQAQREISALRETLSKKISDLEQDVRAAEEEVEKMAAIAEQEKMRSIGMEKQLLSLGLTPGSAPGLPATQQLQQALQERDGVIEQLRTSAQKQEVLIQQLHRASRDQTTEPTSTDLRTQLTQLTTLIGQRDEELQALRAELDREKDKTQMGEQGLEEKQSDQRRLESSNKQLAGELQQIRASNQTLSQTLEDAHTQAKALTGQLEEKEKELSSEKKNTLKRDKTIQGLTLVLREKEKEVEELCHEIEDRDEALAKARDTAHKAQLQKYQGAEEHQNLLMEKQAELALLQGDHHAKVLEAQKLQRSLGRREQEVADLQQAKEQQELELEDLQQQKKKGDKALNEAQNQLKKLSGELAEREAALEQHYQELLEQTQRKLQAQHSSVQRLTTTLADKEQQLQEYMNMVRDLEQSRSPGGSDIMLSKLRERLREKEKALEQALDDKFAAVEEKDNEIHQLQLSLREKERDLERLNNLLAHNEDTISSFDSLIKEKDVELQHQVNTLKNLQRAKQEVEDNLNRSLREKDAIISQLQISLEGKTKDMEDMAGVMLSQSQSQARDLAEQMGQRLKVNEALLAEAVKARERLVADNESAVEGLLATISSKDQLLKESAERYNRALSERAQEIQDVQRQRAEGRQRLAAAEKLSSTATQDGRLETAELRAQLGEKDAIINKLLERGQERDHFLLELRQQEAGSPQVLELRQTIQVLRDQLEEREAERRNSEDNMEKVPLTKKMAVVLKKELAHKTEALNKALKRENELKISVAELQSVLSELEGRIEGQAANIESLTATLETKDEIINELHARLGQRGDSQAGAAQQQAAEAGLERSLPSLPQRERTSIGGDRQKEEALPALAFLQMEREALNRSLRAEQQLYSSLVRTVKEQDSAQRLHALQMELTAVQLLRQQLEEGVRTNEELREDLEREIHRAQLREGVDLVDPREVESIRHQLEDAHRWNTSLQARLGAIQNRGGGVGATNDTADSMSFAADQTSYMSICVGEGEERGLSQLSDEELRHKLVELQDQVSRLQSANADLQRRLTEERTDPDLTLEPTRRAEAGLAGSKPRTQLIERKMKQQAGGQGTATPSGWDGVLQADRSLGQAVDGGQGTTADASPRGGERREGELLRSLLDECGVLSANQLRDEVQRLRTEGLELRGLLKEGKSSERKEKESDDSCLVGEADLQHTVDRLRSEARGHRRVIRLLQEQLETNAVPAAADGERTLDPELVAGMSRETERLCAEKEGARGRGEEGETKGKTRGDQLTPQGSSLHTKGRSPSKSHQQQASKQAAGLKSRLPVPVRLKSEGSSGWGSRESVQPDCSNEGQHLGPDHRGVHGSDQKTSPDSDSPSSTLDVNLGSAQHPGARLGMEVRKGPGSEDHQAAEMEPWQGQSDIELLAQLELLHQECQEKEGLVVRLEEQVAEWEELHSQLQEKDKLNRQYLEALRAAESTIAYLTACNLDSQAGGGPPAGSGSDPALRRQCLELQTALQEKETLNSQLVECLSMAETAISSLSATSPSSSDGSDGRGDPQELCVRLEAALRQVNASLDGRRTAAGPGTAGGQRGPDQELQRQADSLQEALWEQSRLNAELQERLRAAEAGSCHTAPSGLEGGGNRQVEGQRGRNAAAASERTGASQEETCRRLSECLGVTEAALASLAVLCTATGSTFSADRLAQTGSDLQTQLDRLQKVLKEKEALGEAGSAGPGRTSTHQNQTPTGAGAGGASTQNPHHNLCLLQRLFYEHAQRISELQAALETRDARLREPGPGAAASGNAQAQMEALQKALKEKKKTCRSLEEKLVTAQSIIALHNSKKPSDGASHTAPPPEQDEKGVQVDQQDLGYETSGKSETEVDREESSSTDMFGGLQPRPSGSCSLPSLPQDQTTFSSTENLDSASSASYPSSPALSSPKVGLKSLQTYEDYGVSEEPAELRAQIAELKRHLESQLRVIVHLQALLRPHSLSSDPPTGGPEGAGAQDGTPAGLPERGEGGGKEGVERQAMEERIGRLSVELERERRVNRSMSEQLQQVQHRSRSASPARMDTLVQSQARELSQLRQQIQQSRGLGALQRHQLEELSRAFEELLQASDVDYYLGEVFREQLDKSLNIQESLEGRLEKGGGHPDNKDAAVLELAQRLSKELQEKTRLVNSLQSQLRGQTPSSHLSSASDLSDRASQEANASRNSLTSYASQHGRPGLHGVKDSNGDLATSSESAAKHCGGGAKAGGVSGREGSSVRLQRENVRLQDQLRSSEELNTTLRSELDLHRSILDQNQAHNQVQNHAGPGPEPQKEAQIGEGLSGTQQATAQQHNMNPDLLAEHLLEIRALRQRLEETIHTNDRLREQLERRLAEMDRDPAATSIFIQGMEDQGQLTSELRLLWEQNQVLKEQLSLGSRDKQKENDKLREALARRTAKLEQSRKEAELLRQEHARLQDTLERSSQQNAHLQESLHYSREELHRLQCEVKHQRQQLSDSQNLLQSLRVELQVYEKIKTGTHTESLQEAQGPGPGPGPGPVPLDLGELLREMRHLRVQLERSIHTNTALRRRLEEQLHSGPSRDTININYLLSTPEDGGRSPGRDPLHHSSHSHHDPASDHHDAKRQPRSEQDGESQGSSGGEGVPSPPSRLVPGHRLWASRGGRHVLGLTEDHSALRRHIAQARRLARSMDTLQQQGQENRAPEAGQQVSGLCGGSVSTMQQVLEEAGRLLKLYWRVSLPACPPTGEEGSFNHQQEELLQSEVARLKARLSQQERMLNGAVKRLRSTNQLKEGMERVIIDQLALTHGVLKKARGNLETNYYTLFGLKGQSGGPEEGGASQWSVELRAAGAPQQEVTVQLPVRSPPGDRHSECSEERNSDASSHCSY
ncbi:CDK5 regulatory subunit-associated protein 2-like isoform X3 [Hypomesus transpacificus]|uniref:CDK5 regulatory subunit-associated protein 2-like isoform X3 n=1 Tax=Hypomesus transpacificus TaxID=137520 RepID=UPI001F0757D1|nr:CDK5 regulatory subunit-associated protein 2-like isoform X3 [Hypomesus transpacificus]